METKIERLELNNKPTGNAETEAHKEIIEWNAKDGFHYQGFVPVKMGPSGKILAIDLIFQK
jgi:hypothetical protein